MFGMYQSTEVHDVAAVWLSSLLVDYFNTILSKKSTVFVKTVIAAIAVAI